MITGPGKYLTRDGSIATITVIERKGPFRAKGTILLSNKMTVPSTWKLNGQYCLVKLGPLPLDIVSKYEIPISDTP